MQDWDDYRYLLAVKRYGSLSAAAARLSVDVTTVSRRIKLFQKNMGTQFLERLADGSYQLTPIGEAASAKAEIVEKELAEFEATATGSDLNVAGNVRISSVPMIINRLITPKAPDFLNQYPDLELQLNSDVRELNLLKRETDIALRLARPQEGGSHVKVKRVGGLKHAIYISANVPLSDYPKLPWCSYHDDLAHLPQAQWINKEVNNGRGILSRLKAGDAEGVIESVATCQTRSVLPTMIGDGDLRLKRVEDNTSNPDFVREVWLMVHSDLSKLARFKIVADWLRDLFETAGNR